MPKPELIGPIPATATADSGTRRHPRPLPYDLLKEASNRLGIMSLVGAMLWAVGTVLFHVAATALGLEMQLQTTDAIAVAGAAVSLALFFYTRKSDRDPRFILDLGLVYLVITAFAVGVVLHWAPVGTHWSISPTVSWLGALH